MTLFVSNISKCTRSHTLTVVQGRGGGGGGEVCDVTKHGRHLIFYQESEIR